MEDNQDQATKQPNDQDHHHRQHRDRQVGSDLALAMATQQQERAFSTLETIESNDSEEESEGNGTAESSSTSNYDYNQEDYEFFEATGLDAELGFLDEGEEEELEEDMEEDYEDDDEDELDVDELTYEELIALGEFIGVEKRGLSLNEISSCLHPIVWKTTSLSSSSLLSVYHSTGVDRCVVCQVEYEDGEHLAGLPCEHPYHSECISKWLQIKKCCPICSTEVVISSSPSPNNTTK